VGGFRREDQLGRAIAKGAVVGLLAATLLHAQIGPGPLVKPLRATDTLPNDPDDPAIWINRLDPSKSLIFGTVKVAAPAGALAVFDLHGRMRQLLTGPDRPNNVDVEYGLTLGGLPTDIVVLTERLGRRLRAYAVATDGTGVHDISGTSLNVLDGAAGDEGAPMGIGLYRRVRDGAIFAIVAPKAGPRENYLWQYRLADDGKGKIKMTFVRRFGNFSGVGEIEAVAVDDALGYVYYADEDAGIHKWHADPDAPGANRELALFGTTGYKGDREGLGIYTRPDGTGFIVSADQTPGDSVVHLYPREGDVGRPHDHAREIGVFRVGADSTDGLDVTSTSLGPEFGRGLLVAMNSTSRNFLIVNWADLPAFVGQRSVVGQTFRSAEIGKPKGLPYEWPRNRASAWYHSSSVSWASR
jgi:3-phytase